MEEEDCLVYHFDQYDFTIEPSLENNEQNLSTIAPTSLFSSGSGHVDERLEILADCGSAEDWHLQEGPAGEVASHKTYFNTVPTSHGETSQNRIDDKDDEDASGEEDEEDEEDVFEYFYDAEEGKYIKFFNFGTTSKDEDKSPTYDRGWQPQLHSSEDSHSVYSDSEELTDARDSGCGTGAVFAPDNNYEVNEQIYDTNPAAIANSTSNKFYASHPAFATTVDGSSSAGGGSLHTHVHSELSGERFVTPRSPSTNVSVSHPQVSLPRPPSRASSSPAEEPRIPFGSRTNSPRPLTDSDDAFTDEDNCSSEEEMPSEATFSSKKGKGKKRVASQGGSERGAKRARTELHAETAGKQDVLWEELELGKDTCEWASCTETFETAEEVVRHILEHKSEVTKPKDAVRHKKVRGQKAKRKEPKTFRCQWGKCEETFQLTKFESHLESADHFGIKYKCKLCSIGQSRGDHATMNRHQGGARCIAERARKAKLSSFEL